MRDLEEGAMGAVGEKSPQEKRNWVTWRKVRHHKQIPRKGTVRHQ
jgi:hypothetical protein